MDSTDTTMFKNAITRGELTGFDSATVHTSNIHYTYGFGVYESLRVHNGIAYFADEHLERLIHSAHVIQLTHTYTLKSLQKILQTLIENTDAEAYNIKILLIGGNTPEDAQLFMLPLTPKFPDRKWYRDGVTTITQHYERPFPQAKTLSMLRSYLAYSAAREAGCYDALAVNSDGYITEGTRTNFFAISAKTIYSAPKDHILDGVTRRHVLALAQEHGYTLEEKLITPAELPEYDGAFLTSTSSKVLPIAQVDDFIFPHIHEPIRELNTLFSAYIGEIAAQ